MACVLPAENRLHFASRVGMLREQPGKTQNWGLILITYEQLPGPTGTHGRLTVLLEPRLSGSHEEN